MAKTVGSLNISISASAIFSVGALQPVHTLKGRSSSAGPANKMH